MRDVRAPWAVSISFGEITILDSDGVPVCAARLVQGRDKLAEDRNRKTYARMKLVASAPEIAAALSELTDNGPVSGKDLEDAPCHLGICSKEKCGRCSKHLLARQLLERVL